MDKWTADNMYYDRTYRKCWFLVTNKHRYMIIKYNSKRYLLNKKEINLAWWIDTNSSTVNEFTSLPAAQSACRIIISADNEVVL
jgi:hypothetical protein